MMTVEYSLLEVDDDQVMVLLTHGYSQLLAVSKDQENPPHDDTKVLDMRGIAVW
jgi:hypothetical protein